MEACIRDCASVPAMPRCQASPFSGSTQDGQYRLSAAWHLRDARDYSLLRTVRAFDRVAPPTMPSADFCAAIRSPYDDLSLESGTQHRSPEVRSTAFPARPPDLPPQPLMTMDFAIHCSLVRLGRPRIRFLSIGPRLCSTLPSDATSRRRPCASLILRRHQAG